MRAVKWLFAIVVALGVGVGASIIKEHYGDQITEFSKQQLASLGL